MLAAFCAISLSACAVSDGPLVGPRTSPGEESTCGPSEGVEVNVFGVILHNTGGAPVRLTAVEATRSNAEVDFLVDTEGPQTNSYVGLFSLPVDPDPGASWITQEEGEALLAESVPPEEAEIGPGAEANLLILTYPPQNGEAVRVNEIVVKYRAGATNYREVISSEYVLAPGATCEAEHSD